MTDKDLSSDWFGKDGMGDFEFPNPPLWNESRPEHAVLFLIRHVRNFPGQISLICIGPLTNVAHAIKLYPGFLDNLQQIIVMGGAVKGIGNDSPGTEFNFRRDPEATRLVFEHASIEHPVYLLPWETSVDAHITKEWRVNVLGAINNTLMDFMNKVERVVLDRNLTYWQSPDSMAVLAFSQPEVIASMFTPKVYVLSEGELARGVTLLDR
ncbi:probable uridine nucleosidase 2 isoform X1 [Diaphorina citri]|uniref:Probable uridine nucleosidase 2 isoform X1 n=1 Tax=Diaphorina citri TaxID=121845 RepID=A0A3Q0IUX2_DIACI|nr:probable uridine nucleosidase 2 isoform X1 [Diaphorina citri]